MKIYCKDCKFRVSWSCNHPKYNIIEDSSMERGLKTIYIDQANRFNNCNVYKYDNSFTAKLRRLCLS